MKHEGMYHFGEFRIEALARTLRREEEIVTLNRRAFDVLLYFVQNPGRVLTRDELLKNVWPDTYVDENSLAQSISALRRALEEKPGDNSYIVTLPGRGYQFVSQVRVDALESRAVVPDAGVAAGPGPSGVIFQQQTIRTSVITEEKQALSLPASRNRPVIRWIAVLAVAAAAVAGIYTWKRFHRTPAAMNSAALGATGARALARRSIAVLGFRNLSGRAEEGWISTALAEMLSTELEAGEKLRLVSGEDIARSKLDLPLVDADSLSRDTLARLHKDLDSDLIVLGSYTAVGEKPGTRIRLDLRLQDTAAGETIADVAVVGGESDLFDMASQAGSRLREKLGVEAVSPVEAVSIRASLPSNRDAARLYSEGLARLRVWDALEARDLLQRATAADPKFALAHSALAEAWSRLGYGDKAQQEARAAYDLSTNLSREEKLVVEGRYRLIGHENQKAVEVYRALYTLFPDNVDYGLRLTWAQTLAGKGHDALATIESVRKIGPQVSDDPRIDLQEAWAWNALNDFKRQEQPTEQAVEKARAQGSRFILALAQESQCWVFAHLGQSQNAVSACREASDIFASAGDQLDEANTLRSWADVKTDMAESLRLYQQARGIFHRIGCERGEADVLNNMGNLYKAEGDPATAEKMQRQALPIYRQLDDKRDQASTIGNIANERLDRGDLRGAIQLDEERLQLDREMGEAASTAFAIDNLAVVHQLRGDLAEAKQGFEQALAIWQKNGDQRSSASAMYSLGRVMLDEDDLPGARKMYEQVLAIRTGEGNKSNIAAMQLELSYLSLEEGRSPADPEPVVREVLEVSQQLKNGSLETMAWYNLAAVLLAEVKWRPRRTRCSTRGPSRRSAGGPPSRQPASQLREKTLLTPPRPLRPAKSWAPSSRSRESWAICTTSSLPALRSLNSK